MDRGCDLGAYSPQENGLGLSESRRFLLSFRIGNELRQYDRETTIRWLRMAAITCTEAEIEHFGMDKAHKYEGLGFVFHIRRNLGFLLGNVPGYASVEEISINPWQEAMNLSYARSLHLQDKAELTDRIEYATSLLERDVCSMRRKLHEASANLINTYISVLYPDLDPGYGPLEAMVEQI